MKTYIDWAWYCWHWVPTWGSLYGPDPVTGLTTVKMPGEWEFCWFGLHINRMDLS